MSVFKEPQCLIYTDFSSKKLCFDERVVDQLTAVSKQLHVIAIAGLYRTGKSYLLTRIAGRYRGIPLGSAIESETKGIWAWCMDHPVHTDQALLLLDTEGLGDIEKGDRNNDYQILTLATLLSSTLVYNTFGAFDDIALNNMNFITELAKRIKTSEDSQSRYSDTDFDVYFPEFILTLRDFPLDLKLGCEISPDEYLEHCLKAKEGASEEVRRYNEPRLCIRKYFKRRKCFVFERPARARKLRTLDTLTDSDLDEDFVEHTKQFLSYIHHKTVLMTLPNGTHVTGRMFCTLVRNYIDAIRQGAVPCIQSALRSMAIIENESAVKEAIRIYFNEMTTHIILPTQTEQELRDVHLRSKDVACGHFLKRRVLDDDNTYKLKFEKLVHEEYKNFVSTNEKESRKRCEDTLKHLHPTISSKINAGVYAVPGGYELYREDREELKQMYYKTEGLGVMQSQVYVEYDKQMKNASEAVLKSDQTITEKEKSFHLEREYKKRAEERDAMIKKQFEETEKEMADLIYQHDKEIEKVRKANEQDLAYERARYNDLAEKRLLELTREQVEKVRRIEDGHKQLVESLGIKLEQREKYMRNSMDYLNNHLKEKVKYREEKQRIINNLMAELEDEKRIKWWEWIKWQEERKELAIKLCELEEKSKQQKELAEESKQQLRLSEQKLADLQKENTSLKMDKDKQEQRDKEKIQKKDKEFAIKLCELEKKSKQQKELAEESKQQLRLSEQKLADLQKENTSLKMDKDKQEQRDKEKIQKKDKELDEIKNEMLRKDMELRNIKDKLTNMAAANRRAEKKINIIQMVDISNNKVLKAKSMMRTFEEVYTNLDTPCTFNARDKTIINTSTENLEQNAKEQKSTPCDVCAEGNIYVDSEHYCTDCNEFLCNTCKRVHSNSKASRHHVIFSGDQMPSYRIACGENIFCEKHTDEVIKFRCSEHEVFACDVCVTIDHKGCPFDNVRVIGERFHSSKEFIDLKSEIRRLTTDSDEQERVFQNKKEDFQKQSLELAQAISAFQSDLMDKIHRAGTAMSDQIMMWRQIMLQNTDTGINTLQSVSENLKYMLSTLNDLEQFMQHQQLVVTASKCTAKLGQIKQQIESVDSTSVEIEADCNEIFDEIRTVLRWVKLNIEDEEQAGDSSLQHDVVGELEKSGQEMFESVRKI